MISQYSLKEAILTGWYLVLTKIFYRPARLVRFPFYCRGTKKLSFKKGFTTGRNCRFDLNSNKKKEENTYRLFFGENCKLGDNVHIVANSKVIFGDDCLLASNIFISDTSHGIYKGAIQDTPCSKPDKRALVTAPVSIGNRVWIGENVSILPGVTIGSGVIIGANSVVNKDIPDNVIVGGVPARIIKKYNFEKKVWMRESKD